MHDFENNAAVMNIISGKTSEQVKIRIIRQTAEQFFGPSATPADQKFPYHSTILGLMSMSTEEQSREAANIIAELVPQTASTIIIESGSGIGGNSVGFARLVNLNKNMRLQCVELDKEHARITAHNIKAAVGDLGNQVEVINSNFIQFASGLDLSKYNVKVMFIDPPWGGAQYNKSNFVHVSMQYKGQDYYMDQILDLLKPQQLDVVMMKLPKNFHRDDFYAIVNWAKSNGYIGKMIEFLNRKNKQVVYKMELLVKKSSVCANHFGKIPDFIHVDSAGYRYCKWTFV